MKKVKKIMLVLLLTIGTYLLVGVSSVRAVGKVVCNPNTLASSTSTTQTECFVLIENSNSTTYHGFALEVYTTKNLEFVSAKSVEQIKSSTGSGSNVGVEVISVGSTSKQKSTYTCGSPKDTNKSNLSTISSATSSQCVLLYSNNTAYFTPTNMTVTASDDGLTSKDANGYYVIGSITAKLNTTNINSNNCGEVCVLATGILSADGYRSKEQYSETDSNNHPTVTNDESSTYKYACGEVHYNTTSTVTPTTPDPKTGSFISYAILAAGAFIAISAVAIAKKNKKVYKV